MIAKGNVKIGLETVTVWVLVTSLGWYCLKWDRNNFEKISCVHNFAEMGAVPLNGPSRAPMAIDT